MVGGAVAEDDSDGGAAEPAAEGGVPVAAPGEPAAAAAVELCTREFTEKSVGVQLAADEVGGG